MCLHGEPCTIADSVTQFPKILKKSTMFDLSLESGMDTLYYAGYRTVCGAGGEDAHRFRLRFDLYGIICRNPGVSMPACRPAYFVFANEIGHGFEVPAFTAAYTLKCAASAQSWRK